MSTDGDNANVSNGSGNHGSQQLEEEAEGHDRRVLKENFLQKYIMGDIQVISYGMCDTCL